MFTPRRETIEAHPLIRRLSGQVIWCMFEEQGAAPRDIQAFLDSYERLKNRTLEDLEHALAPGSGVLAARIMIPEEAEACPRCRAMHGRLLPAAHPSLAAFFPPYALGCPARAELLDRSGLEALNADRLKTPSHNGLEDQDRSGLEGLDRSGLEALGRSGLEGLDPSGLEALGDPHSAAPDAPSPHGELVCRLWARKMGWNLD